MTVSVSLPDKKPKNPDIQILRGIGIIMVMTGHYIDVFGPADKDSFFAKFSWWTGVDLFFAISGFLIAGALFKPTHGSLRLVPWRNFRHFWGRRFFRLMPSAWFWLAMVCLIAPQLRTMPFQDNSYLFANGMAALTATANIYWATCFDLAAHSGWTMTESRCGNPDIGAYYWSLSLEEQFYLVLSLAGLLAGLRKIALIAVLALIIQFLLPRPLASTLWFFRTDALCGGVLVYCFSSSAFYRRVVNAIRFRRILWRAMFGTALLFLLVGPHFVVGYSNETKNGAALSVIGMVAAFAVLIASCGINVCGNNGFARFLAGVGGKSYSLYLSHLLIYHMIYEYSGGVFGGDVSRAGYAGQAIAFAPIFLLCLGCADLSYRYIEAPMINKGRRIFKAD